MRGHWELRKRIFPPLQKQKKKTIEKAEHLLQFTELQAKLKNLMHYEYIQGNSNHVDVLTHL